MDNEQYIESGLSVGTTKIANKYEIFTEEEIDAINNKIPELDERVDVIEDEIEEINSSLDSKANKTETATIQQQVNNLVLGAVGDGNNAEVVQARGGEKLLNNRLSKLDKINADISTNIKGLNLYNIYDYDLVIGKSLNGLTNEEIEDNKYILSGYCEVEVDSYYLLTADYNGGRTVRTNFNYAWYDENKNYINGANYFNHTVGSSTSLLLAPSNAKYVRIALPQTANVTIDIAISKKIMLIKTTLESCNSDSNLDYCDYINYNVVSEDNLSDDVKLKIKKIDRIDVDEVNKTLSEISTHIISKNLFDVYSDEVIVGKSLNGLINTEIEDNKYITSGYCTIESNSYYLLTLYYSGSSWGRSPKSNFNYAWYDENKNYISGQNYFKFTISSSSPVLLQAPSNAKYIRFSLPCREGVTLQNLIDDEVMLYKTTLETCVTDERFAFVDYINSRKVTINNLDNETKDKINSIGDTNGLMNLFKIQNKYRYLVTSFLGTRRDGLVLLGTNDLKRFDLVAKNGIYITQNPNSKCVRDPSIIQIGDYYYLVYTVIGFDTGNDIGFCRTKDFVNFEELDNLFVFGSEAPTTSFNQVWAPAWFRDIDGSMYIISACKYEGESFYTYINKYNVDTHTLEAGHKTNVASIDAHIYYENGFYYMFVGGAFIRKSETLFGEWVGISNNNLYYTGYEADFAVKLDNGGWRLYMQQLIQNFGTSHMVYVDAPSLDGVWSDPKLVEYTKEAYNYQFEVTNSETSEYWHWTIFDFSRINGNNNYFIS